MNQSRRTPIEQKATFLKVEKPELQASGEHRSSPLRKPACIEKNEAKAGQMKKECTYRFEGDTKEFCRLPVVHKGDLSTVLDGMKVGLVISALMRDVRDKKVIDLIKAALTTPVITKDEPKPDPYWLETFFGFAPEEAEKLPSWGHCGILSPLLANICLDELDRWMEGKTKEFYRPSKSDVIWNSPEGEVEQGNTSWPEFVPTSGPDKTRKMDYIRFGGHILIGVRGPRADAATLRKQLIEFCDQKVVYPTLRYTATGGKIISEKGVGTLLSVTASLKQCIKQFRKLNFLKEIETQTHSHALEWVPFAKLYAAKYKLRSRAKVTRLVLEIFAVPEGEKGTVSRVSAVT
nr:nuclear intron maturase 2, mitochondrial [Ipomoea batatas]